MSEQSRIVSIESARREREGTRLDNETDILLHQSNLQPIEMARKALGEAYTSQPSSERRAAPLPLHETIRIYGTNLQSVRSDMLDNNWDLEGRDSAA